MRGKIVSKLGGKKQVKEAKAENLSAKLEVKMPEDPWNADNKTNDVQEQENSRLEDNKERRLTVNKS